LHLFLKASPADTVMCQKNQKEPVKSQVKSESTMKSKTAIDKATAIKAVINSPTRLRSYEKCCLCQNVTHVMNCGKHLEMKLVIG